MKIKKDLAVEQGQRKCLTKIRFPDTVSGLQIWATFSFWVPDPPRTRQNKDFKQLKARCLRLIGTQGLWQFSLDICVTRVKPLDAGTSFPRFRQAVNEDLRP
jgi:hypothetical protein